MAYTVTNYRTKKALKEALATGTRVEVYQPGPFGPEVKNGAAGREPQRAVVRHRRRWRAHAAEARGMSRAADCLVCGLPVGTYPSRCFACSEALERAHGSAWYLWRAAAHAAVVARDARDASAGETGEGPQSVRAKGSNQ
jgi:hypothetical protein